MVDDTGDKQERVHHGGRNLILLGAGAILIALATTSISLAIYHKSGDIYLDRSRPGFLPDEEEAKEDEEEEEYDFSKSGKLTINILEEYLERLDIEVKAIDAYEKPFDSDALSDSRLGIPKAEVGD